MSILWRLTATSRSNCSRLLFPESGFNGARFLVSFGYNFKDYNKAILSVLGALSNAARFPELRQCLYFSDLFRLVDCALDNYSDEYSVQIAAGELLCQLCMEKELLQKTTDFGVARLLTKLESILTSVAVERKLQNEASACQNLCPFVEMIGCSFAPEVALFGLWRIASLYMLCEP